MCLMHGSFAHPHSTNRTSTANELVEHAHEENKSIVWLVLTWVGTFSIPAVTLWILYFVWVRSPMSNHFGWGLEDYLDELCKKCDELRAYRGRFMIVPPISAPPEALLYGGMEFETGLLTTELLVNVALAPVGIITGILAVLTTGGVRVSSWAFGVTGLLLFRGKLVEAYMVRERRRRNGDQYLGACNLWQVIAELVKQDFCGFKCIPSFSYLIGAADVVSANTHALSIVAAFLVDPVIESDFEERISLPLWEHVHLWVFMSLILLYYSILEVGVALWTSYDELPNDDLAMRARLAGFGALAKQIEDDFNRKLASPLAEGEEQTLEEALARSCGKDPGSQIFALMIKTLSNTLPFLYLQSLTVKIEQSKGHTQFMSLATMFASTLVMVKSAMMILASLPVVFKLLNTLPDFVSRKQKMVTLIELLWPILLVASLATYLLVGIVSQVLEIFPV